MKWFLLILTPLSLFAAPYLKVKIAENEDEQSFGLMNCRTLPQDEGMLFIYDEPKKVSFWMFNCFIDLSIAFVDKDLTITSIQKMEAYPFMMDPKREVTSLQDFAKYPPGDPILSFFAAKSTSSHIPIQYVIEANKEFFDNWQIKKGDKIYIDNDRITFFSPSITDTN